MRHFHASSSSTVAGETVSIIDVDPNDDEEKNLDSVTGALTRSFDEGDEESSLALSVSLLPGTRHVFSRSTEDNEASIS